MSISENEILILIAGVILSAVLCSGCEEPGELEIWADQFNSSFGTDETIEGTPDIDSSKRAVSIPDGFQASFYYIGNYPSGATDPKIAEIQGIANDNDYWYFSRATPCEEPTNAIIYQIPYDADLAHAIEPAIASSFSLNGWCSSIPNTKLCSSSTGARYTHVGDVEHHYSEESGHGYLFAPFDTEHRSAVIGVFRVGSHERFCPIVTYEVGDFQVDQAGWVAVKGSKMYSSKNRISTSKYKLHEYDIDWSFLDNTNKHCNMKEMPNVRFSSDEHRTITVETIDLSPVTLIEGVVFRQI